MKMLFSFALEVVGEEVGEKRDRGLVDMKLW